MLACARSNLCKVNMFIIREKLEKHTLHSTSPSQTPSSISFSSVHGLIIPDGRIFGFLLVPLDFALLVEPRTLIRHLEALPNLRPRVHDLLLRDAVRVPGDPHHGCLGYGGGVHIRLHVLALRVRPHGRAEVRCHVPDVVEGGLLRLEEVFDAGHDAAFLATGFRQGLFVTRGIEKAIGVLSGIGSIRSVATRMLLDVGCVSAIVRGILRNPLFRESHVELLEVALQQNLPNDGTCQNDAHDDKRSNGLVCVANADGIQADQTDLGKIDAGGELLQGARVALPTS